MDIISKWTKSSNLEKFVLEDISKVADNLLLWRQYRKSNEWQEESFDDFCFGIVLLEELVKPL